ncbi:MAG: hypothetical protein P8Z38_11705 [Robiginitalea sp.]
MKNYLILILAAIVVSFSSCQQKEKQSTDQNDVVGVYEYTANLEGMSIFTEKYFVAAAKVKNESSTVDSTNLYKNLYNSLVMEGGTWTKEDSIVTCTYLFAKNPSLVGKSFRFTYTSDGDSLNYYVLNDNNERIGGGTNRRLTPSNTQNDLNNLVARYINQREGMAVHLDGYFVYAWRNKHEPLPVGTEDYYEKEYKSLVMEAGKYTMQDSIVSNYLLFLKGGKLPSRNEPSFRWTYSFKGDSVAVYILNKEGEASGNPMYSILLK